MSIGFAAWTSKVPEPQKPDVGTEGKPGHTTCFSVIFGVLSGCQFCFTSQAFFTCQERHTSVLECFSKGGPWSPKQQKHLLRMQTSRVRPTGVYCLEERQALHPLHLYSYLTRDYGLTRTNFKCTLVLRQAINMEAQLALNSPFSCLKIPKCWDAWLHTCQKHLLKYFTIVFRTSSLKPMS